MWGGASGRGAGEAGIEGGEPPYKKKLTDSYIFQNCFIYDLFTLEVLSGKKVRHFGYQTTIYWKGADEVKVS